jgi:hypothetical protein
MNQTKNLKPVMNLLSFSGLENLSVSILEDKFLRITKKNSETSGAMELPVNNYLKTPEEIEREFQSGISSRKAVFQKRKDSLNNSDESTRKRDGYINIHNPDEALSGFMEENY